MAFLYIYFIDYNLICFERRNTGTHNYVFTLCAYCEEGFYYTLGHTGNVPAGCVCSMEVESSAANCRLPLREMTSGYFNKAVVLV
jgi:hypothetical protein